MRAFGKNTTEDRWLVAETNKTAQEPAKTAKPVQEELRTGAAAILDALIDSNKELEIEDVDQFLNQQDPEFSKSVGDIAKDKNLKAAEIADLDDDAAELFEETQKWAQAKGLRRLTYRVFPFMPKVTVGLRRWWFRAKGFVRSTWILAKNEGHDFAIRSWKATVQGTKDGIAHTKEKIRAYRMEFRRMPRRIKALYYLTILIAVGAVTGIYFAVTGRILPKESNLFLTNFEDVATEKFEYQPGEDQEFFYDNLRSMPNLFLIPKIVANIRPSRDSGPNPMVAVEFFAETFSPEAMFELKDREPMVRDVSQRTVEEFSFEELESPPGKQKLTQVVSRELNRVLTKGQLKSLRIKTIVLKP